jgi:outer membrane protein assembly factor BamB
VNDISRPSGEVRKPTDDTGYAAPTLTTDGRYVYGIFATGDVICVDKNGKRIWGRNIGIPDNHYGHSSSLLLHKDLLLIQFDTNAAGKVLALKAGSGETAWETLRDTQISWASPVLAKIDDHYELILTSAPLVAGYDPVSGDELWSIECLMGEVGPSPAYSDGLVFAANEYARLCAIKPGKNPEMVWESNEYLPEVSSPVADEGMIFIATSYGVIACFDTANGELLWEHETDNGFYASPMIAGNKVYFLDTEGIMYIFSKEKTKNLLAESALGEGSVSTPAFTDGRIYLRSRDNLYCIGK